MTTALNVREWNPARPTLGTGCGADRAAKQRQPAPLRLSGGLPSMTINVLNAIRKCPRRAPSCYSSRMPTPLWPQPNARALRMAVSRSPSSFPSASVKQAPELAARLCLQPHTNLRPF